MKLLNVINFEKTGLSGSDVVNYHVLDGPLEQTLKFSYVNLDNSPSNINYPKEPDVIFDTAICKNLIITYPLKNTAIFSIRGNSRNELIKEIVEAYHKIYDIEEQSSTAIARSMGFNTANNVPGLFGIWGHSLRDLVLHRISIYKSCILLGIDS